MEHESIEVLHDKDKNGKRNKATESSNSEVGMEDACKMAPCSPSNNMQVNMVDWKGEGVDDKTVQNMGTSGEVNMEASVTADDVIRAGGFGARDDISSFLPIASDWTDFEASIRNARDYEEPQGDVSRPGLGWKEASSQSK
ncbi:uncharacterized protein LOC120143074 [Hibiscus syriacus]|uniref:uncharacterized protein LOC120143074 n=1 Tax=Hibiscus syriacus TaxID=106335 RepID=UPI0019222C33|nr:uncharacterized protein LOC120143074 [Hibiscus syriacus]